MRAYRTAALIGGTLFMTAAALAGACIMVALRARDWWRGW